MLERAAQGGWLRRVYDIRWSLGSALNELDARFAAWLCPKLVPARFAVKTMSDMLLWAGPWAWWTVAMIVVFSTEILPFPPRDAGAWKWGATMLWSAGILVWLK